MVRLLPVRAAAEAETGSPAGTASDLLHLTSSEEGARPADRLVERSAGRFVLYKRKPPSVQVQRVGSCLDRISQQDYDCEREHEERSVAERDRVLQKALNFCNNPLDKHRHPPFTRMIIAYFNFMSIKCFFCYTQRHE